MFYDNLKDIYSNNSYLQENFPLEEYSSLLRQYLIREIKNKAEFVTAEDFALQNAISYKSAVNFFVAISAQNNLFERYFRFNCEECDAIQSKKQNELIELLSNYSPEEIICPNCHMDDFIPRELNNLYLVYKLNYEIREELVDAIKKAESSFDDLTKWSSEEDFSIENQYSSLDANNPGKEDLEQYLQELQGLIHDV